ncbi:MAG TPA: DUF1934 domain-containing protein [Bacillota bacterium]|nr:DUF1934 domain-containing protein [Bacillota bacterium]
MLSAADINREAIINLTSSQWADGEQFQPVRLMTHGQLSYQEKDRVWNVSYDESDATGMRGTRTRLSLFPDGHVVLRRTGEIEMEIEFVKGDQRIEQKRTPYGLMKFSVLTHEARGEMTADGGDIELGYSLGFDNRHAMSTKLHLQVLPESEPLPPDNGRPKNNV